MLADYRKMTEGWNAAGLFAPSYFFWAIWCAEWWKTRLPSP